MLNRLSSWIIVLCGLWSSMALAQQPLDLSLPGSQPLMLAAAEEMASPKKKEDASFAELMKKNKAEYHDRWFTLNKAHKYLGIGSLLAGVITVLLPKEEDGPHHTAGETAAGLGGAAVVTGLLAHYEDLSIQGGFDNPDNMHAALGTLGALGFIMAADTGPDTPHATYGVVGGLSMALAIKYTW